MRQMYGRVEWRCDQCNWRYPKDGPASPTSKPTFEEAQKQAKPEFDAHQCEDYQ